MKPWEYRVEIVCLVGDDGPRYWVTAKGHKLCEGATLESASSALGKRMHGTADDVRGFLRLLAVCAVEDV